MHSQHWNVFLSYMVIICLLVTGCYYQQYCHLQQALFLVHIVRTAVKIQWCWMWWIYTGASEPGEWRIVRHRKCWGGSWKRCHKVHFETYSCIKMSGRAYSAPRPSSNEKGKWWKWNGRAKKGRGKREKAGAREFKGGVCHWLYMGTDGYMTVHNIQTTSQSVFGNAKCC